MTSIEKTNEKMNVVEDFRNKYGKESVVILHDLITEVANNLLEKSGIDPHVGSEDYFAWWRNNIPSLAEQVAKKLLKCTRRNGEKFVGFAHRGIWFDALTDDIMSYRITAHCVATKLLRAGIPREDLLEFDLLGGIPAFVIQDYRGIVALGQPTMADIAS